MSLLDKKTADTHSNASTQINVPQGTADEIVRIGRELIPDEHLAGDGREELVHVTLKFGVRPDVEAFRKAVAGQGPFKATLGKVVTFPDADTDGIPVVVEVHGHGFKPLHDAIDAAISARPDDFPYTAHITIAYVKEAEAQHYAGSGAFEGIEFDAVEATISLFDDDNQVDVPLAKTAASPAVMPEIPEVAPQYRQEEPEEEVGRDEPATQEEPEEEQAEKPKRRRSPLLKKQPKPKQIKPPAENRNFKRWFGKSKVRDDDGKPMVVYHGTTHDFQAFDPSRTNVENYYGRALYFTSDKTDVGENYATEAGPDITSRIEHRSENIAREWEDQWDEVKDDLGLGDIEEFPNWSNEPDSEYQRIVTRAKEESKKEIAGQSQGMTMPVYLSIQNPVVVQQNGGTEFELRIDDEGNESGSGLDLYNAMNRAAAGYYNADAQEVWGSIIENSGENFNAWDFEKRVRSGYVEDNEGNQAAGSFISDVYQEAGFDGIIQDAYAEFGSRGGKPMTMEYGTKHYIIWDPHKIKSAIGNVGKYDPKNPSITAAGGKRTIPIDDLPAGTKADLVEEVAEHMNRIGFEAPWGGEVYANDLQAELFDLAEPPMIAVYNAPVERLYAEMKRKNSPAAVKKYVEMLKSGMEFDPIFVRGGKFHDGGHRLEAYHLAGRRTIPVAEIGPFLAPAEFWQRYFENDPTAKMAAGEKSVGDLGLAKKIMHELMPVLGVQLPEPELKIVNQSRATWLGRDTWYTGVEGRSLYGDETTTVSLQRSILRDENTLRRVIAHELAHHADNLVNGVKLIEKWQGTGRIGYGRLQSDLKGKAHGEGWLGFAQKYNAKFGADFVTEKSDESYVLEELAVKPYFISLWRKPNGKIYYATSMRLGTKGTEFLWKLRAKPRADVRVTTAEDRSFVSGSATLGDGRWTIPTDDAENRKLQELWDKAAGEQPMELPNPWVKETRGGPIPDAGLISKYLERDGKEVMVKPSDKKDFSGWVDVWSRWKAAAKTAGKRDEATTSMTVGTQDPDFPMPVLIRWEPGMRWRAVLKAVKSVVNEIAGRRVAWRDIHIWASLWDSREAQEQGWEQEKAKGSKVMYDILHNGTHVRVDHKWTKPVALGATDEKLADSHKVTPLDETYYNDPGIGEETNAYADIPERVRGQYDVPPIKELAPQLFKEGAGVSFRTEFRGSHDGQSDITLFAEVGDNPVGYVDYSVYQGRPAVQYINVSDKRKGYGTALLRKLQSMFPGAEVGLGGTTPDGTKLVESLKFEEEPTEHAPKFEELGRLTKERDRLQAVADEFYAGGGHSEQEKEEFKRQMEGMNEVHDRIWQLEQETLHESPSRRLISALLRKAAGPNFPPTFEQYVQKHGGVWKYIDGMGDAWSRYEETLSMDNENFGELPEKEQERLLIEYAMEDMESRYQGRAYQYNRISFPVDVWREISLKDPKELKTKGIGVYWSWSEDNAEAHWGTGGDHVMLHATLTKPSQIDWDSTMFVNLDPSLGDDENEARLKDGTRIKLVEIESRSHSGNPAPVPQVKLPMTVTAVYGEAQNQVQHTDQKAVGMTKTLKSNPFADELEALKGEEKVELNPSLDEAVKSEGQPRAKGEEQMDAAHAQKLQRAGAAKNDVSMLTFEQEDEAPQGFGNGYIISAWTPSRLRMPYSPDELPVGRIDVIVDDEEKEPWVFDISVEDDWRGTGLGQALYDRAIAEARKRGFRRFNSSTDQTPEARAAWARLGKRYPMEGLRMRSGEPYSSIRLAAVRKTAEFPPFEQWVEKHPEFGVFTDDTTGESPEDEDSTGTTLELLAERYAENVQWLSALDLPLEIYRALEVEQGSPVNTDSAGVHWTWVENSADAYFGGSSLWAKGSKPKRPELVIMKAEVTNPGDIDFERTLFNNMQNPDENEITLRKGADVRLVGVMRGEDNDYRPAGQTVTARTVVNGEDVVSYVAKLNDWDRDTAYQVVGLDAGGDYVLRDYPLGKLTAGDDYDPDLAEQYSRMEGPFPPIVLGSASRAHRDKPTMVSYHVIRDGNHRVAAAKLRGDSKIGAYVPIDTAKKAAAAEKPVIEVHGSGDVVWIDMFSIPEAWRGKGHGAKVYGEWEAKLPKNFKLVRLYAGDTGAGQSNGFWEKMGFSYVYDTEQGDQTDNYMWKGVNGAATPKPVKSDRDQEGYDIEDQPENA